MLGIAPLNGFVGLEFPDINMPKLNIHLPKFKLPGFSALFATKANAENATSGSCGNHLNWEYDSETQTLSITGTGEMYISPNFNAPWKAYRDVIRTIVIEYGATTIGAEAFMYCTAFTSIIIPDSIKRIENRAFYGCTGLTSVTIGSGVTSIGAEAFSGCTGLLGITIPDNVLTLGYKAFYGCTRLSKLIIIHSWVVLNLLT